jgi:hypothetical protein
MNVVKFPILKCRDCDATTIAQRPGAAGWEYVRIVENPDSANGWRCPKCAAGWNVIVEESPGVLH